METKEKSDTNNISDNNNPATKSLENTESLDEKEPFDEILEGIPKEERHEVKKMIGMSMQMGRVMSPEMELMKKMTPEHVSDFLDTQKKAMEHQFEESRDNKIFIVIIMILILIFILALIFLLRDKPSIMEKVLYTLGGLITGLFGGYGYGKTKNDD